MANTCAGGLKVVGENIDAVGREDHRQCRDEVAPTAATSMDGIRDAIVVAAVHGNEPPVADGEELESIEEENRCPSARTEGIAATRLYVVCTIAFQFVHSDNGQGLNVADQEESLDGGQLGYSPPQPTKLQIALNLRNPGLGRPIGEERRSSGLPRCLYSPIIRRRRAWTTNAPQSRRATFPGSGTVISTTSFPSPPA